MSEPYRIFAGRGDEIVAALESLSSGTTTRKNRTLPPAAALPAIPARTGTSPPISQSTGTGGGIASPLVEMAYGARTWHSVRTIVSSDGLFRLRVKPVKTVTFNDANGAEVIMEYKAPT